MKLAVLYRAGHWVTSRTKETDKADKMAHAPLSVKRKKIIEIFLTSLLRIPDICCKTGATGLSLRFVKERHPMTSAKLLPKRITDL